MATDPWSNGSENDDVRMEGDPDPLRLWVAGLAVRLYEGYLTQQSPQVSAEWAIEDTEEIYRIFLGMTEDIDDLSDKPDAACVQQKLPKERRPTRKEKRDAIRACRKKK